LNICLPFVSSERQLALEWIRWVKDFCGFQDSHDLFLLPFRGVDHVAHVGLAKDVFANVNVIRDAEGRVSDWKSGALWRDALGPNSLFRQAAWHFYNEVKKGPWFFCEPDCCVIRKDAFDAAAAEYVASGKPFMGVVVEMPTLNEEPKRRLNGTAIYHEKTPEIAPNLFISFEPPQRPGIEAAFDIGGRGEVIPNTHNSRLFQHKDFGNDGKTPPTFPRDTDIILPHTAFFHRCKDGTLYRMLSKVGQPVEAGGNGVEVKSPRTGCALDLSQRVENTTSVGETETRVQPDETPVQPPSDFSKRLEEFEKNEWGSTGSSDQGRSLPKNKAGSSPIRRRRKRKKRQFTPEHLANLRAAAANARAAKIKKNHEKSSTSNWEQSP
jgi:hypothetical protein